MAAVPSDVRSAYNDWCAVPTGGLCAETQKELETLKRAYQQWAESRGQWQRDFDLRRARVAEAKRRLQAWTTKAGCPGPRGSSSPTSGE